MSTLRALFRCDEAIVPDGVAAQRWTETRTIASRGQSPSLNLRAQNLVGTVLTSVTQRAADLVRIAAYVYAADQEFSRGGSADVYGRDWRRQLALCIPVGDTNFWQRDEIRERLAGILGFLTEDQWEFYFSPAAPEDRQI